MPADSANSFYSEGEYYHYSAVQIDFIQGLAYWWTAAILSDPIPVLIMCALQGEVSPKSRA